MSSSEHFPLTRWFTVTGRLLLGTCDPFFIMKKWFKKCPLIKSCQVKFMPGQIQAKINSIICCKIKSLFHAKANSLIHAKVKFMSSSNHFMLKLCRTKVNSLFHAKVNSLFHARGQSLRGKAITSLQFLTEP